MELILFYLWLIITVTVLFYALCWILELVFPKFEGLIKRFKNYFKGGAL